MSEADEMKNENLIFHGSKILVQRIERLKKMSDEEFLEIIEKSYNEGNLPKEEHEKIKESFREVSADEMFKELGYKKVIKNGNYIKYFKDDDNVYYFLTDVKEFYKSGEYDGMCGNITMQELQAINEKVLELRVVER